MSVLERAVVVLACSRGLMEACGDRNPTEPILSAFVGDLEGVGLGGKGGGFSSFVL